MDDEKLSGDPEERPRIKVTDRRKFAADGTPRSSEPADADPADTGPADTDPADAVPADAHPVDTAPANAVPAEAHPADTGPANAVRTDTGPAEDEQRIVAPQPSIADLPRDFSAFVEGMYLEAMLYLGAMPDPRSGQVMEDIELARYKIDLLSMIQVKTQGNLTDDEIQQLEEVLYQLRTVYVETTKAADS